MNVLKLEGHYKEDPRACLQDRLGCVETEFWNPSMQIWIVASMLEQPLDLNETDLSDRILLGRLNTLKAAWWNSRMSSYITTRTLAIRGLDLNKEWYCSNNGIFSASCWYASRRVSKASAQALATFSTCESQTTLFETVLLGGKISLVPRQRRASMNRWETLQWPSRTGPWLQGIVWSAWDSSVLCVALVQP
jgi:hypothetical protein